MNRIQKLRKERKITQKELTKILNVQRQTLSKYENGAIPLTDEVISILAKYFSVTTDYLLGIVDDPTSPQKEKPLPLDDDSKEALEKFEKLSNKDKLKALGYMDSLNEK